MAGATRALGVPELVQGILQFVDRRADLAKTARVSLMWRAQSEAILYVDPLDWYGDAECWSLLVRTLASRPDLAARVQALDVGFRAASDPRTGSTEEQLYLQLLTQAANLVDVTLNRESRAADHAS